MRETNSKSKNKLECHNEKHDILHVYIIQWLQMHGLFPQTSLKVTYDVGLELLIEEE